MAAAAAATNAPIIMESAVKIAKVAVALRADRRLYRRHLLSGPVGSAVSVRFRRHAIRAVCAGACDRSESGAGPLVGGLFLVFVEAPVAAGPPFLTDDPVPVD
jgi:hypothetical protein